MNNIEIYILIASGIVGLIIVLLYVLPRVFGTDNLAPHRWLRSPTDGNSLDDLIKKDTFSIKE